MTVKLSTERPLLSTSQMSSLKRRRPSVVVSESSDDESTVIREEPTKAAKRMRQTKSVRFQETTKGIAPPAEHVYSEDFWLQKSDYDDIRRKNRDVLIAYAKAGGNSEQLGDDISLRGLENHIIVALHGGDRLKNRKVIRQIVLEQNIMKLASGVVDEEYLMSRYADLSSHNLQAARTLANIDAQQAV